MVRRVIVSILCILLLLLTTPVFANSAAPPCIDVKLKNVPRDATCNIMILEPEQVEVIPDEVDKKHIRLYDYDQIEQFSIRVNEKDGTMTESNVETKYSFYDAYEYDFKTNELNYVGNASNPSNAGAFLALFFGMIILVCVFNAAIESGIAFVAKVNVKPVLIINLITNPILNILYPIFTNLGYKNGIALNKFILILLEAVVVFVEYLYLKKRVTKKKPKYIFAFTLIANIISFGLYYFFIGMNPF